MKSTHNRTYFASSLSPLLVCKLLESREFCVFYLFLYVRCLKECLILSVQENFVERIIIYKYIHTQLKNFSIFLYNFEALRKQCSVLCQKEMYYASIYINAYVVHGHTYSVYRYTYNLKLSKVFVMSFVNSKVTIVKDLWVKTTVDSWTGWCSEGKAYPEMHLLIEKLINRENLKIK